MRDARCQSTAELVLGTVQLGMAYGATNKAGKPTKLEALKLLKLARQKGIRSVDTARAYGTSEEVIGAYQSEACPQDRFEVLTKLDPRISELTVAANVAAATRQSLDQSRKALRTEKLSCVMLHRPDQILSGDSTVSDVLKEQKSDGRIGKIGVSVSTPGELVAVLRIPEIDHVQFPFNFLDHRFEEPGVIALLNDRKDVTMHIRSVFLQGILVCRHEDISFDCLGAEGVALQEFLQRIRLLFDGTSPVEIALAYVKAMTWVDGLVIGTAAPAELEQVVAAYAAPTSCELVDVVRAHRPRLSEQILNPTNWPKDWA
ncbi:MAG: aldo/keto reductase [Pseudomonadota bacterium]